MSHVKESRYGRRGAAVHIDQFGLRQRAGGQGEAGAGAGEGAACGAMALGAADACGAGLDFFFGAGRLRTGGAGAADCNSANTGLGTIRASLSPEATTCTGTVCG